MCLNLTNQILLKVQFTSCCSFIPNGPTSPDQNAAASEQWFISAARI